MIVDNDYIKTQDLIEKRLKSSRLDNKPVLISNVLTRQKTRFTLEEEQLLFCVLSKLKPFEKNNRIIEVLKEELFEKLGLFDTKERYMLLKKRFQSMMVKTYVSVTFEDKSNWNGFVITGWGSDYKSNHFKVEFNERFLPYVEELLGHYTRLELDSVVEFKSKYSLSLYKYLSSWKDNGNPNDTNQYRYLSTKELKELFGLGKEDYVYNDKFNRALFEKKTVDVAVEEINSKTNDLRVSYTKVKKGNRVIAYMFDINDMKKINNITNSHTEENQISINDLI